MYHIKTESVYKANPMSLGAKVGKINTEILEPFLYQPSFGLRTFEEEDFFKIINLHPSDISEKILEMKKEPVSFEEQFKGPSLTGPHHIHSNLPLISEKQRRLDEKMTSSLRRMVEREYSMFG